MRRPRRKQRPAAEPRDRHFRRRDAAHHQDRLLLARRRARRLEHDVCRPPAHFHAARAFE